MQIADLVHQGFVEKEIAEELYISKETVHTHTKNIRRKLNARNAADITRIYLLQLKPYALVLILAIMAMLLLQHNPKLFEALQTSIRNFLTK